jgi:phosphoglucomutase
MHDKSPVEFHKDVITLCKRESKLKKLLSIPRRKLTSRLKKLSADAVKESDLAGEPITATLTVAQGNHAPFSGLKAVAKSGWFAARSSGTEDTDKIYAESFKSEAHLYAIAREVQEMVNQAVGSSGVR